MQNKFVIFYAQQSDLGPFESSLSLSFLHYSSTEINVIELRLLHAASTCEFLFPNIYSVVRTDQQPLCV